MGCCSVTQRHSGVDTVGPDEIELVEVDSCGLWGLSESKQTVSVRSVPLESQHLNPAKSDHHPIHKESPVKQPSSLQAILWGRCRQDLHHQIYSQPIQRWEGQSAAACGDIVWSSRVALCSCHMKGNSEKYLVLFSFHLLILDLDNVKESFIYEGILPLSGMSARAICTHTDTPHTFEISAPMVEPRVFACSSGADLDMWLRSIEDRQQKARSLPLSPSHRALSHLVPCDQAWKKEELKRYLLQAPIWQWEGTAIQHMGHVCCLSLVHITNAQRQGSQKQVLQRLFMLFPEDLLLLSVDSRSARVKYEGRMPRKSVRAVEQRLLSGRLQFQLTGDLMEPLLVSCSTAEDYQSWIFHLQQCEADVTTEAAAPPALPKKSRG